MATSIGAEGIEAVDGREILFANSIEELAERCVATSPRPYVAQPYRGWRPGSRGPEDTHWRQAQKLLLDRYATLTSRSR